MEMNNIKVEIIEDGSICTLGYTVPSDEQGIADDILFVLRFGNDNDEDSDDLVLPTSWTPAEEVEKWRGGEIGDMLNIMYTYGVKMHRKCYEAQQGFYTAVQESGFSDDVISNYWNEVK
jgi:hypothetical protein